MQLSAGDESGAVLPEAKKNRLSAVARAAGFRRRRKKASETHMSAVGASQQQTPFCR
jgi:hypothetical protein